MAVRTIEKVVRVTGTRELQNVNSMLRDGWRVKLCYTVAGGRSQETFMTTLVLYRRGQVDERPVA